MSAVIMALIALVAFSILWLYTLYIHVLTRGSNAFSHVKDHFQPSNLFLHVPFMCCETGCTCINLFAMHAGK